MASRYYIGFNVSLFLTFVSAKGKKGDDPPSESPTPTTNAGSPSGSSGPSTNGNSTPLPSSSSSSGTDTPPANTNTSNAPPPGTSLSSNTSSNEEIGTSSSSTPSASQTQISTSSSDGQAPSNPPITSGSVLPIIPAATSNATTCMPLLIQWTMNPSMENSTVLKDSAAEVLIIVTNHGVEQSPIPASALNMTGTLFKRHTDSILETITNDTSLGQGFFNWTAVNVPSGWYVVEACPPYSSSTPIMSDPFFVVTGSNTTCIPPRFLQESTRLTPAALAGTIVGGVVGVTALIGAFYIPRLWRRGVPPHKAWSARNKNLYHIF